MKKNERRFRAECRALRKKLPLSRPVSVRRGEIGLNLMEQADGSTVRAALAGLATFQKRNGRRGYLIVVDSRCTMAEALETLHHEWAHCLAEPIQRKARADVWSHDGLFGIEYARVTRVMGEGADA